MTGITFRAESLAPAMQNRILTSKSGPRPSVLNMFDFEMRFAPQRRALFEHLNFQKCSENGVLCTFLTSKHALRHNGVRFFNISTSKRLSMYMLTSKRASGKNNNNNNGVHFFDASTSQRRAILHLSSPQMASHPPL